MIASAQIASTQIFAVANSASYTAVGRGSGAALAQGSLIVIFGTGMGPFQLAQASSYPLPTRLSGTSIRITVGGTSVDAPIVYTSDSQVAAILPSRTPLSVDANLTLTYNNRSRSTPISINRSSFGIYTLSSNGIGPAVATTPSYEVKNRSHPAAPGEVLTIWGTGLGAVSGDEAAGPLPGKTFDVEVFIGGRQAELLYAGRSGCCSALDQIIFRVPAGIVGCSVPVAVRSGGITSNFATLPLSTRGPCIESSGLPESIVSRILAGEQVATAAIGFGPVPILEGAGFAFALGAAELLSARLNLPVSEEDVLRFLRAGSSARRDLARQVFARRKDSDTTDLRKALAEVRSALASDQMGAAAAFSRMAGLGPSLEQFAASLPPVGTCTVVQAALTGNVGSRMRTRALNAGRELSLQSPLGTRTLRALSNGHYQVSLGSGFGDAQIPTGLWRVTGAGGLDIGAFTASLSVNGALRWLNKANLSFVDRSQPLIANWTASGNGRVLFGGGSSFTNEKALFLCVEEASKGTLAVPAYVLSAIPSARSADGYLFLARHPLDVTFTAPGLDLGYVADFSNENRSAEFR